MNTPGPTDSRSPANSTYPTICSGGSPSSRRRTSVSSRSASSTPSHIAASVRMRASSSANTQPARRSRAASSVTSHARGSAVIDHPGTGHRTDGHPHAARHPGAGEFGGHRDCRLLVGTEERARRTGPGHDAAERPGLGSGAQCPAQHGFDAECGGLQIVVAAVRPRAGLRGQRGKQFVGGAGSSSAARASRSQSSSANTFGVDRPPSARASTQWNSPRESTGTIVPRGRFQRGTAMQHERHPSPARQRAPDSAARSMSSSFQFGGDECCGRICAAPHTAGDGDRLVDVDGQPGARLAQAAVRPPHDRRIGAVVGDERGALTVGVHRQCGSGAHRDVVMQ